MFYNATEGTGRRARTVKRSYVPTSDLVKEHRTATKNHAEATKEAREILRKLNLIRKEATAKVKETAQVVKAAEVERDTVWATGWPGPRENAPRPPVAVSEW